MYTNLVITGSCSLAASGIVRDHTILLHTIHLHFHPKLPRHHPIRILMYCKYITIPSPLYRRSSAIDSSLSPPQSILSLLLHPPFLLLFDCYCYVLHSCTLTIAMCHALWFSLFLSHPRCFAGFIMVLRKCTICDRRFKKTEHFKRHERSR